MATITWFVDAEDVVRLKQIREAIYAQKENFHRVVINGKQEDVDIFVMDWMHAPATNFECLNGANYLANSQF